MKPGSKLKSAACDVEVMVIKAAPGVIACGGSEMVAERGSDQPALDPGQAGGCMMGKRYTDADGTVEVLCIKPGAGSLSFNGVPMQLKDAKPLPASD